MYTSQAADRSSYVDYLDKYMRLCSQGTTHPYPSILAVELLQAKHALLADVQVSFLHICIYLLVPQRKASRPTCLAPGVRPSSRSRCRGGPLAAGRPPPAVGRVAEAAAPGQTGPGSGTGSPGGVKEAPAGVEG